MKKLILLATAFVFTFFSGHSQQHQLVKRWQTDSLLKVPESVLLDAANNLLYVSNIDGDAAQKDGKGSIGKLGLDGKIISVDWVSGLNAPKGMGLYKGNLYVADLGEVVVIDTKTGRISKHIPVEGATFLNDVTIDKKGIVYVSDTRKKKVHRIENGTASVILDSLSLKSPNGLLATGDNLYVLDAGSMYKVENDKRLTKIADGMEASTDGIENVKGNEFIVSCWIGAIYYINGDGSKQKLLDTQEQKINSADICYDSRSHTLYVPNFAKNTVTAYDVR